jgi:peroxiredoxin (alkyl hydroperoxide reductase subunit C)
MIDDHAYIFFPFLFMHPLFSIALLLAALAFTSARSMYGDDYDYKNYLRDKRKGDFDGHAFPFRLPKNHDIWSNHQPSIPLPRSYAPDFSATAVLNDEFTKVSLSDYLLADQWVVLFFYPFDYTFVCPTEIRAFSAAAKAFKEMGVQVAAVSTDSQHTHLAWTREDTSNGGVGPLEIPLIADVSKSISFDYGVLVTDPDDDMYGAALRGVFVIDPNGKVRSVLVNDDGAGRNVEEVMRTVQALQYIDSHDGEGCPAGWTPGAATIKTDSDGAKEFFRAHK